MSSKLTIPPLKSVPKKKRGSRKLLTLLVVFFISVFAYLFFQSPLAKISLIEINGNEVATSGQIGQAAGVVIGDSYFKVKSNKLAARVEMVGAVKTASVVKKFPGQIIITITEYSKAAYRIGANGQPEAILADGTPHLLNNKTFPSNRPILTGWDEGNTEWKHLCSVLAAIPDEQLSDVSEIKPYPNVFEDRIKLYTRSRFEVITRISLLQEKLLNLPYYTSEFKKKNGTTGVLWLLDQDRGIPFELQASPVTS
ncbi:MAG: FtsQ-type POTRA domain-containing protein [Gorillibacterium sp.]|nr:FtsQ-type POTRA domain-containing protein [Gorillibacterium sp.]